MVWAHADGLRSAHSIDQLELNAKVLVALIDDISSVVLELTVYVENLPSKFKLSRVSAV